MENTQLFFNKCLDGNEFEQMVASTSSQRQQSMIGYGDSLFSANFRMQLLESVPYRKFIQASATTTFKPTR